MEVKTDIPKIIHQIWLDKKVSNNTTAPTKYYQNGFVQSWHVYNDDFECRMWNVDMAHDLFNQYPSIQKYRNFWLNLPVWIEKCDVLRYLIMATIGGFYIDLDFRCLANIGEHLYPKVTNGIMLFFECKEHTFTDPTSPRLSNSMMVSVGGGHPFWFEWLDNIVKKYNTARGVLTNTGPTGFSSFAHSTKLAIRHPEWFGNKCWVMPYAARSGICKECEEYCTTENDVPNVKTLTSQEKDPYSFSTEKANQLPYKKMIAYTEWTNGTGWGSNKYQLHSPNLLKYDKWYPILKEEKSNRVYDFTGTPPENLTTNVAFITPIIVVSILVGLIIIIVIPIAVVYSSKKPKQQEKKNTIATTSNQ